MKKLFLVRHGDYDDNKNLSERGRQQLAGLSDVIAQEVGGQNCLIISSTAPRAKQSAEILAKKLGQTFELRDVLWTCEQFSYRPDKIMTLIKEKESTADCLVLVSHLELVRNFPEIFTLHNFGTPLFGREIPKGTAFMVDCQSHNMRLIS